MYSVCFSCSLYLEHIKSEINYFTGKLALEDVVVSKNKNCCNFNVYKDATTWKNYLNFHHNWFILLTSWSQNYVVVDWLFIVTPIVGVCGCSMFCCALLYVHSSFAIILVGRGCCLLCLVCLPGVLWLLCGSSSRCHGFVCSLWLWYFLIIPTYYF